MWELTSMCSYIKQLQCIQYVHTYNNICIHNNTITIALFYIDPPDIDQGSFVARPSVITRGNKRVKIGTPVYVYGGFDVIIDCNILTGAPPINITWFHNGSPDTTRGNVSTITITDASNGDVFKCKADNKEGCDTESINVHVEYGKYVRMYVIY